MSCTLRVVPVLALGVAACGPSAGSRAAADSLAPATSALAMPETGTTLAERGEAQPYLDSARTSFLAGDARPAAFFLTAAAEVNRRHAAEAVEPAKGALLRSAAELDDLAALVAARGLGAVASLDTAFARLHLAEVQHHCTRAEAAWAAKKAGPTAAELLMLADHFERAAHDAAYQLPFSAVTHLATARSLASLLSQTGITRSPEVDVALADVDRDVHALIGLIGQPATDRHPAR